jgi:hypothetical protein
LVRSIRVLLVMKASQMVSASNTLPALCRFGKTFLAPRSTT